MRTCYRQIVAVPLVACLLAVSASAQQALDKLERMLDEEAAETQPAKPTPAEPLPKRPASPTAVKPGYLGLFAIEVDGKLIVETVRDGSPAATANIQPGDEIVRVGAAQPASLEEMSAALSPLGAGSRVPLSIKRAGRTFSAVAVLSERPPTSRMVEARPQDTPADPSSDALGALNELDGLLDDIPPAEEGVAARREPPSATDRFRVLKRAATLEAELKLINARIDILERRLNRVESTLTPEP